jgi:hypothetical protein
LMLSSSAMSADASAPHATVIPLPASVWSGAAGLVALAFAGSLRRLPRIRSAAWPAGS